MKKKSKKFTIKEFKAALAQTDQAIEIAKELLREVKQLKEQNYRLKTALALMSYKRPKGRPRKKRAFSLSGALFGAMPKKKGGRPAKYQKDEMRALLQGFEKNKLQFAKSRKARSLTDKTYIEHLVNDKQPTKSWRLDKRQKEIKEFCGIIKYFREETNTPQKKKKRKTS